MTSEQVVNQIAGERQFIARNGLSRRRQLPKFGPSSRSLNQARGGMTMNGVLKELIGLAECAAPPVIAVFAGALFLAFLIRGAVV